MKENLTVVSRCQASQCRFNENEQCSAGQIELSMSADSAQCLTFSAREQVAAQQPTAQQ